MAQDSTVPDSAARRRKVGAANLNSWNAERPYLPDMTPADRKYTKEHEWVKTEKDVVTLGVTHYAQEQLTDIVFVELPDIGRRVKSGESIAVVESVKSVSDVYSPVTGTVTAVNEELVSHPEKVNESPYEEGWIVKLKVPSVDSAKMMDAAAYDAFVASKQS
jgi:glycine cleavage system H protein